MAKAEVTAHLEIEILDALELGPASASELAADVGVSVDRVERRVTALMEAGVVEVAWMHQPPGRSAPVRMLRLARTRRAVA